MLLQADIRKMLVSGDQWGEWRGYQLPISDSYISIWTPAGTEMHWKPGSWVAKRYQLSYFWPGAWYTLHIGYNGEGSFVSGYCDVILPTPAYTSTSRELVYIDLYIDVVVREDFSVFTKDQEVFDRAALRYPLVEQSRAKSFEVLDWLEAHAKRWTGPFAIIPKRIPRTDFEQLSPQEARASMQSVL